MISSLGIKQAIIILFIFLFLVTCGCLSYGGTGTSLDRFKANYAKYQQAHDNSGQKSYLAPIYNSLKNRQYDNAVNQCEKLRETHPDDNNIFLLEGYAHRLKKDYSSSIDRLSRIIDSDKIRGDAYFFRAESYYGLKKLKKALHDISKALENKQTPAQMIWLYKGIGYKNVTVETSKRLIYELKSIVHSQLGEIDPALESIRNAIEYDPNYSPLYGIRGRIYLRQQKYSLAYKEFKKVIEINPKDSVAWDLMGLVNFFRGDYNMATTQYQKAYQLDPENITILLNTALSYWLQGSRVKAFEAMGKVLRGKPHSFSFYHLAYFHHLNGDQDRALVNFKKARELNPDILKIRETLLNRPPASSTTRQFYQEQFKTAKIYIETGKTPMAIAHGNREPTLEIQSVTLEPDPVPVNQPFDFHVMFKTDIPGSPGNKIATTFYFKILQNNKTIFPSKFYSIKVNNGEINTRTQHMNPVPAKGVYTIRVFVEYKNLLAEKSIALTIK